jgi:hypothetical protein
MQNKKPPKHGAASGRNQIKPQRHRAHREKHFGRGFSQMNTDGMARTFAAPKGMRVKLRGLLLL